MAREEEAIRIYCRIRPSQDDQTTFEYKTRPNNDDVEIITKEALHIVRPEIGREHLYQFNQVFQENTPQQQVFEEVAQPILDRALEGYNGTIFAYGQTATGKTHTILGKVGEDLSNIEENTIEFDRLGIIPRTAIEIFNAIGDNVTVAISYMEIYNEIAYDLLNHKVERGRIMKELSEVRPRYNQKNSVFYLPDLSTHKITNASEAMKILMQGNNNRHIAETKFNHTSSRSHCILTFKFTIKQSEIILNSKINLVDLAGSERVGQANETNQDRIREANNINKSLLYLELVMSALSKREYYIPFRNSMLTKCLQSSLVGNSLNTMIATICNETRYIEESISTCRFAQDVAAIKNVVVPNVARDLNIVVLQLEEQLENLKQEHDQKANEMTQLNQLNNSLNREMSELRAKQPKSDPRLALNIIESRVYNYVEGVTEKLEIGNNPDNIQFCHQILKGIILKERENAAEDLEKMKRRIEQQPNKSTRDKEQQTDATENRQQTETTVNQQQNGTIANQQRNGSLSNGHLGARSIRSPQLPDKTINELNLLVKNFILNSIEIDVRMDVTKIQYCFELLRDEVIREKVERVKDEAVIVGQMRNKIEALEERLRNVSTLPNISFSDDDMYDVRAKLEEFRFNGENNLNKDNEDDVIQSYLDMVKEKIIQGKQADNNYVEEIRILKDEIAELKYRLEESEANSLPLEGSRRYEQLTEHDKKKMEVMILQFIEGDIDFLNVGLNQANILFCFNQLKQQILLKRVTKTVYIKENKKRKSKICVIL